MRSTVTTPTVRREAGFTTAELLVSMLVSSVVLLGVLLLFDFSQRISRVQTNVAEMQQSLRVGQYDAVRLIRMAGRGGLPLGNLPNGRAVALRNNVAAGSRIGPAGTPAILAGTDVLTVRGVFSSPIYQVASADPASFVLDNMVAPATATHGTVVLRNVTPTGIPQDLTAIIEAVGRGIPEALLLVSPRDAGRYTVVELDPVASNVANPAQIQIGFHIRNGTHTAAYSGFSADGPGTYPADLTSVAFVGILEEYRFYVREEYDIPGDAASDLTSKLSRARVYPGTELPWRGDDDLDTEDEVDATDLDEEHPNWRLDIADNILDFQVALGLDSTYDGTLAADDNDTGADDEIREAANGDRDDWLFNGTTDTAADPAWAGAPLYYIRLSTLARTDRRDSEYEAPPLARVEDRTYATTHRFNVSRAGGGTDRMFRRRLLQTVVDMRNL